MRLVARLLVLMPLLWADELKRFQMMPTDSGNWRYSGKRNGGDDRVFALLLAVAGAEFSLS